MTEQYSGPATATQPNGQPVEKVDRKGDGTTLDVHSVFETIQGEGPFAGHPCVFIRLAGCNLQCPWCDTEYTQGRARISFSEILAWVKFYRQSGLVVITGGEPFRQQLGPLCRRLCAEGYFVQIETNGTLEYNGPSELVSTHPQYRRGVYVVCSPKTGKVHASIAARACCYKYVLDHRHVDPEDGLPTTALGHVANPRLARPAPGFAGPIYLQPADHQDEAENRRNLDAVVSAAMRHGYLVQLQIHKYLGVA